MCSGNEAWPIGVTSIGIHERSSREKISHVMNTGGAAHIMNDEATRKYLQAMKRLLTTMQRLFPTDPSRCMDFDGFKNEGRGAAGGGSDRLVRPQSSPQPPTSVTGQHAPLSGRLPVSNPALRWMH